MAFKPSQITKENILNAIKNIESNKTKLIEPTRWQVIINNKPYPPKEVMKYAHEQMNGEKIWNYGGGEGTNKFLKKFGFEMIDMHENSIKKLIEEYKKHIQQTHLNDEKYKWELLSKYKGSPNLETENLYEELKSINYANLIYALGKSVVYHLVNEKPNEMRILFKNLFNENQSLSSRINTFNLETLTLYRSIGQKLQHHQDERTIGTYLAFHNPEKYTFYKYSFYKKMCEMLNEKEANKNEKYEHYLSLVNQIIEDYIQDDNELIDLVKSYIPQYYDGSNHLLLTQDILYQMLDKKETVDYWVYAPGENAHKWEDFYEEGIMGLGWDDLGDLTKYATKNDIKKKLQKIENVDSSKQNDTAANYDFYKTIKEGDIIIVKKGLTELLGYGEVISDYYYNNNKESYQKSRDVDWKLKGNWKVDFNLPLKTLTNVTKFKAYDTNYSKYYEELLAIMEVTKTSNTNINTAMENNISLNQILYGPPGTGKTYHTINKAISIINPNFDLKQNRDFIKKEYEYLVEKGQIVFTTFHQSLSYEDFIEGIKPKTIDNEVVYEIEDGVFKQLCTVASTKSESNFEESYTSLIKEILEKENDLLILKTPKNKEFRINVNSNNNLNLYTSENINKQGTLTKEKLLKQVNGFSEFNGWEGYVTSVIDYLKSAHNLSINTNSNEKKYVLIIDEINRGNVSAIFGELITLVEHDKRIGRSESLQLTLPYSKKNFGVPKNVYIIGTMNTADRSVESLDTALRRRFSFVEMMPKYDKLQSIMFNGFNLGEVLETINKRVEVLLDRDHTIGHSYFIAIASNDVKKLLYTFQNNIIPLLQEYFYGDYEKIALILGEGFVDCFEVKENNVNFASFSKPIEKPENVRTFQLKKEINNIEEAIQLLLNKNA